MHTERQLTKTVKVYQMCKCHQIQILDLRFQGINRQKGVISKVCHQFRYKINFKNKEWAEEISLLQWVNHPEGIRQPTLEEAPQQVFMYKVALLKNQRHFFSKLKSKCVNVTWRRESMLLIHLRKKMKMEIWSRGMKKQSATIFSLFIRRGGRVRLSSRLVPRGWTELTSNTKLTFKDIRE